MPRRPTPPPDTHREREATRRRIASAGVRDIGMIPKVAHPRRKRAAARDFHRFCLTYLPDSFPLPFCEDHLVVISRIQTAVLTGGLFAVAMPRGSGKTTLCEAAALWGLLYGHQAFVVIVALNSAAAQSLLDSIKGELEGNERLAEDFPEVCYPIERLERIVNRCKGQTCRGVPTRMTWADDQVVLPTIPGSKAAGAVVRAVGILGSIRGLKHKRADGKSVRPTLVFIDDPQDEESSESPSQCAKRERILAGSILNLAGPGKKIAGLAALTVIRRADMADSLLDRKKHPEWKGERFKMVYAFPTNETLWNRYAEMYRESLAEGRNGEEATAYYLQNRLEMDEGCRVYWPERFNHDEVSAIQHAMNRRIIDEFAFMAECQNQPMSIEAAEEGALTAAEIAERLNRHKKGLVPRGMSRVTAFVDVHQALLYWLVAAWGDDFTGAVLDYGCYPDQGRSYWTLRDAKRTLAKAHPGGMEASIAAGLSVLLGSLLAREWELEGGGALKIEKCLVDANWGETTELVYRTCRMSPHAAILTPSHGKGITAAGTPIADWPRKDGERRGHNWIQPQPKPGRLRHVIFDANHWKTAMVTRLRVPVGAPGALTLFGDKPAAHRLLADHLTGEYRVRTQRVGGREIDEWKVRPDRPDVHLLDCLTGAAVAASMCGCAVPESKPARPKVTQVDYAELYKQAHKDR